MPQIVYTHQLVDAEGVITESKFVKRSVKTVDEFVLLYIQHISLMARLPRFELQFLLCVAPHISYNTGEFTLDAQTMEQLTSCSGLKRQSIYNATSRLTKKNIIQRIRYGWYKINPEIFWKGSELERQKQFQLTYQWTIQDAA